MTVKLIHGDCIEKMQKLIDDGVQVDLTVTSPPYANLRTYNDSLNWEFNIFKQVADKLYQITKDGGVVVWVVNDTTENGSETGISFKQALYFKDIGFNLHDTMIYKKKGVPYPEFTRYYPCFEYMFVFSKGKPKSINLIKDRKNKTAGEKIDSTHRQADGTLKPSNALKKNKVTQKYGVRLNMWEYGIGYGHSAKEDIAYQHPAIFPIGLAKDHIKSWSNPNDLVLDCFMGSGTTGVACQELDRDFIGIEKVEEYYNIAKERCKEYQSKLW